MDIIVAPPYRVVLRVKWGIFVIHSAQCLDIIRADQMLLVVINGRELICSSQFISFGEHLLKAHPVPSPGLSTGDIEIKQTQLLLSLSSRAVRGGPHRSKPTIPAEE